MAVKQFTDIADRAINSLSHLQRGKWWDAMQAYQNFPICDAMMRYGKEKSGKALTFRIGVGQDSDDGHHGLYEDYDLDRPDVMTEGTVNWRNHRKGFAFDLRESDQGSEEELVNDLVVQRNNMWAEVCKDMEQKAWQVPASSDKLLPNGIPYYAVWEDITNGGFTSNLPTGNTLVANIDPAVQDDWRNWTEKYTNYTSDDLGLKVSRAMRKIQWTPPMKVKGEEKGSHVMLTTLNLILNNELTATQQNDRLGFDTAAAYAQSMLARVGLTWCPALDDTAAASSEPLYILNWTFFYPCFKKGWKFLEYPPVKAAKQPTAIEVTTFSTYNWACMLRNRMAVLAQAAPFGES